MSNPIYVAEHTLLKEFVEIHSSVNQWVDSLQRNFSSVSPRILLEKRLKESECLGHTRDGKHIYLYQFQDNCPVMHEMGKLREEAFRAVGEGTGKTIDIDHYDKYYDHLILWDDQDKAFVGAYRIGHGDTILNTYGFAGFYTSSLFKFNENSIQYLNKSVELGRSFVNPAYWGTRALDYLWYGIAAYLKKYPDIRYLIGPVSISNAYDCVSQALIVEYYKKHYHFDMNIATSRLPFTVNAQVKQEIAELFHENCALTNFKALKQALKKQGKTVPILYKHYIELCDFGGISMVDFNVDPHFSHCIDGLMVVDFTQLKPQKHQRYMSNLNA